MRLHNSLVGMTVGRKYRVQRVLGIGGMGVVCEAKHAELGKRVAVKIIERTMASSNIALARFRREARAAAAVESEHIVDVFDVGDDDTVGFYMVMEYLEGEDLDSVLKREGKLDVITAVQMAHQLARGLAKSHAARVVHRDLKPGNVFFAKHEDGSLLVKILDFGISKILGDDVKELYDGTSITGDGPVGTPLYMSPEQAEGEATVDGRSDIWSLGAVLFEALAGRPPHEDPGQYHVALLRILTQEPPPLAYVAPWVPRELAQVVDAMLVRDRDFRIADCAEVSRRLLEAVPYVRVETTGPQPVLITSPVSSERADDTAAFDTAAVMNAVGDLPDLFDAPNSEEKTIVNDPAFEAEAYAPTEPPPPLRARTTSSAGVSMSTMDTPSAVAIDPPLMARDPIPSLDARASTVKRALIFAAATMTIVIVAVAAFALGSRSQKLSLAHAGDPPPQAIVTPIAASSIVAPPSATPIATIEFIEVPAMAATTTTHTKRAHAKDAGAPDAAPPVKEVSPVKDTSPAKEASPSSSASASPPAASAEEIPPSPYN